MLFNKRDLVSFLAKMVKLPPRPLKLDVEDQRSSQAQGRKNRYFPNTLNQKSITNYTLA